MYWTKKMNTIKSATFIVPMSRKRLARKISVGSSDEEESSEESITTTQPKTPTTKIHKDMFIMEYSPKSIVVMGETLDHSKELSALGGKYTQLRMGMGWLFAKIRQESVENYINTGEVVPYQYTQADRDRFAARNEAAKKASNPSPGLDKKMLRKLFKEFREAFDEDEEYDGTSIIEVIYQLEERYMEKLKESVSEEAKEESPTPSKKKTKRLARKI